MVSAAASGAKSPVAGSVISCTTATFNERIVPTTATFASASASLACATVALGVNITTTRDRDARKPVGVSSMSASGGSRIFGNALATVAVGAPGRSSIPTTTRPVSRASFVEWKVHAPVPPRARPNAPPAGIGPESKVPSSAVIVCVAPVPFTNCAV